MRVTIPGHHAEFLALPLRVPRALLLLQGRWYRACSSCALRGKRPKKGDLIIVRLSTNAMLNDYWLRDLQPIMRHNPDAVVTISLAQKPQ